MLFSYSLIFPIEQSAEYWHKNKKMAMLEYQITIMLSRTLKYIGRVWELQLYLCWNLQSSLSLV